MSLSKDLGLFRWRVELYVGRLPVVRIEVSEKRRNVFVVVLAWYSPAAKLKNISLCGEIMKLGTLIGDPCKITFRLGPNSETPPGGRHLEF